jgi:serine phosphatase RsbU (regulator of sigma subunit)
MRCREIVGSNLATSKAYRAEGLDIYVQSAPYSNNRRGGGDVYHVTTCESEEKGKVTRLTLADISGHGEEAADLAVSLTSSLQKNVDRVSQSGFVQQVNEEFSKTLPRDRFATAVVATYFVSQKRLSLGVAGHPNPLLFRHADQRWYKVDEQAVENENQLLNVPFGISKGSAFPTRNIQIQDGDMFLLYSDAFIESVDRVGEFLGVEGMLEILNSITFVPSENLISRLRSEIRSLNASNLIGDDATLILGNFKPQPMQAVSWQSSENMLAAKA